MCRRAPWKFGKLVTTWISLGVFQHALVGLELTCSSCVIWPMNYLNYWQRFIIHMLFGDCQNYFVHHYIPLSQYEYITIINVIKNCTSGFAMKTETYIDGVVTMGTVSTCWWLGVGICQCMQLSWQMELILFNVCHVCYCWCTGNQGYLSSGR